MVNSINRHFKFEQPLSFEGLENQKINHLLNENYFKKKQPLYSKLPFSYTLVPAKIRTALFNLLLRFKKDPGFPSWPIEKTIEELRSKAAKSLGPLQHIGFWPEGKNSCICLTHDCDSISGMNNIEKFRKIEEKFGFKSAWNIVPNKYEIDFEKLKNLENSGCEIGIHGYDHSGETAYLETGQIDNRILKAKQRFKEFQIEGFRSELLNRNSNFLDTLSKHFKYDSSVPDTDIYSPMAYRNGCCSVFPYFIGDMVEIPLTMPQDWRLIRMGLSPNEILDIWKKKLEFIQKVGGVAVINIHPDDFISGNEKYLKLYEELLQHISLIPNKWMALPFEIAVWWNERDNSELKDNIITGSKRAVIKKF